MKTSTRDESWIKQTNRSTVARSEPAIGRTSHPETRERAGASREHISRWVRSIVAWALSSLLLVVVGWCSCLYALRLLPLCISIFLSCMLCCFSCPLFLLSCPLVSLLVLLYSLCTCVCVCARDCTRCRVSSSSCARDSVPCVVSVCDYGRVLAIISLVIVSPSNQIQMQNTIQSC
jgi:hypothetical protein